jgi:hypothetical protein
MMTLTGKERLVHSIIYSPGKELGPIEENASTNKKYDWASAIRLSLFLVRKGWLGLEYDDQKTFNFCAELKF